MKKKLTCLMLAIVVSVTAHASLYGGHDGNGGDTVESNGKRQLLDLIEQDSLEYFDPIKLKTEKVHFKIGDLVGMMSLFIDVPFESLGQSSFCYNPKEYSVRNMNNVGKEYGSGRFRAVMTLSLFSPNGDGCNSEEKENAQKLIKELKLMPIKPLRWAFVDQKLEDIHDEGFIRLQNSTTKKQVAIQKDGLVVISRQEFNLMDGNNQTALFLHELTLRSVLILNPSHIEKNGTEFVRGYVRAITKYIESKYYGDESVPQDPIMDAFAAFGIK